MDTKQSGDIRRRWELRVLIALPAVWVLLAAVEAYLAIEATLSALGYAPRAGPNALALEKVRLLVIGIGSVTALALGVAFAVAITRPMRQLLQRIQHRLRGAAQSLTTTNEIQQLSNAFDDVLLSFDKFVSDSHIIDGMPVGILVVDKDDAVVRANAEAQRLFHPRHRALPGGRLTDLCSPGMAARLDGALTAVRSAGTPIEIPGEILFGSPNGPMWGPLTPAPAAKHLVTLQPTMNVGEVVVAIRDLSHLTTIRGQIQRIDGLAALGAHVASLAHEISGGLMGIQVLIDLLQPRTPEEVGMHNKLCEEVERAVRLLTEIRTFGQASVRERVLCDLARLVEETLWMLDARFIEKQIHVVKQLNPDLPPVLVDRDRVIQAILNVVTNAFEATPSGGTVSAVMDRIEGATLVKISNTGSFIPPEERQKIFTLFYTTKRSGSGFGLPLARRALLDHGGDIEVTSSPERGTEFVLRFPDQPPISEAPTDFEARQPAADRLAG